MTAVATPTSPIQKKFTPSVSGILSANSTEQAQNAGGGSAEFLSRIGHTDTVEIQAVGHRERVGVDLATALGNGKPTLLLFTPVELCRIRYCLQPKLVMERLTEEYADQINFVVAPVYAVDAPDKPRFPIVDLGVYLVEPYASWVPEMVKTEFGWGIAAPSILLVDPNGSVLYRGSEYFAVGEMDEYVN